MTPVTKGKRSTLWLALHTVRFLRGRQIVGQLRQRARRYSGHRSKTPQSDPPPFPGSRWTIVNAFLPPCPLGPSAERMRRGTFEFLNSARDIGWPPTWSLPEAPKLWQYNLHYHDFIWSLTFEEAKALVLDWMERCPIAERGVGWEPYPVSLRLTNWCACLFGQKRAELEADRCFKQAAWASIYQQASFLEQHIETHLLGNHVLENAVALSVAGACFGGPEASRWLHCGAEILGEQLPEQILGDGGHFERSPMYHSRVVWCLLTLLNTGEHELATLVRAPLERALRALSAMCHPDGQIALLNDSAMGIYAPPMDLLALGRKVFGSGVEARAGSFSLSSSGYYGSRTESGHYVICDFAPIGPDHIPGHAHGDMFSFELSYHGHRVIVDSGVCDYEMSGSRSYCRSTRAHNTVTIDDEDQCEFWGTFRVARRGRPRNVRWEEIEGGFRIEGSHDGYHRLPGKSWHNRSLAWHDTGVVTIRDRIHSKRSAKVVSRIHLHPDCRIERRGSNWVESATAAGQVAIGFTGPGTLSIEESSYYPEFGRAILKRTLAWSACGDDVELGVCIAHNEQIAKVGFGSSTFAGNLKYAW